MVLLETVASSIDIIRADARVMQRFQGSDDPHAGCAEPPIGVSPLSAQLPDSALQHTSEVGMLNLRVICLLSCP